MRHGLIYPSLFAGALLDASGQARRSRRASRLAPAARPPWLLAAARWSWGIALCGAYRRGSLSASPPAQLDWWPRSRAGDLYIAKSQRRPYLS